MISHGFPEILQNSIAAVKPECLASVVIPVRNEAVCLPATLESLARQVDWRNQPLDPHSYEIIILANNCRDDSAAIVRRWQTKNPALSIHLVEAELPPENANIGYVRRILMNEAAGRLRNNRHKNGIIMTTDGDTRVAPNWVAANLYEIADGAEAVGGRILVNAAELRQMGGKARRFHLLDVGYRLAAAELEARLDVVSHDYLPRHHQHFNGSFAVTTEAFQRAGGVPDVRFLEDVAFYQALLRVDARVRHSPLVRVETSARCTGRTELGLSTQLTEWTIMGGSVHDYFVESAAAIERRVSLRARLRKMRKSESATISNAVIAAISGELFISEIYLGNEIRTTQTFGAMWEKIEREQMRVGDWARNYPLVAVEKALFDLRRRLIIRRGEQSPNIHSFSQTSSR